jgi:serine/threonine protein kinase
MIGREIAGRYRILAKLGEGGMGAVYRAEQISLKRRVALKLLKPELSAEPELVRRFNAEAELAAKLSHPNTVTLYDFGQCSDGALFIAMEFIEGTSLRQVVHKEAPLPASRTLAICEQICASLGDAHARGIVHRDLKPDNIMLTERGRQRDVVRVLDFGIAKLRDEQGDVTAMPMTRAGDLLGTPQYMAPEQIRGEKVDARTDVYALGAMIYEMTTGRLPFEAPSLMAILSKHLTEMPEPPRKRRPDLHILPELERLIMQALQKQPAARPQNMEAMAEWIAQLRGQVDSSHAPTPSHQTPSSAMPPTLVRPNTPVPVHGPAHTPPTRAAGVMASPPPGVPRRTMPSAVAVQPGGFMPPPGAVPMPPGAYPPSGGYAAPTPHPGAYGMPHGGAPAPAPRPRTGLWAALAVLVAGGAGVGIYAATRDDKAAVASADADAGQAAPGPDQPGQPEIPSGPGEGDPPISGDFATRGDRQFYGDGTRPNLTPPLGEREVAAISGDSFTHPDLKYTLIIPSGWNNESAAGVIKYTGSTNGGDTMLLVYGMDVGGMTITPADLESVGQGIASTTGGTVVQQGYGAFQGEQRPTGIVDMPTLGKRGEYVVFRQGSLVVVVAVATTTELFGDSASFRREVFEERFRMPR